jgi:hypothetical protein
MEFSDHPLTKIPILQRVFLFTARKLSAPIKLASVTSSWDESLRVYGAGSLVWQKAYEAKPSRVASFLHLACSKGGVPWVVDHLCRAGVDPNVADKGGNTALHMIAKFSFLSKHGPECIGILAKAGANLDAVNNAPKSYDRAIHNGLTPLQIAFHDCPNGKIVDALLKCGANINCIEIPKASTLLNIAAASGDGDLVTAIIEYHKRQNPDKPLSEIVNERAGDLNTALATAVNLPGSRFAFTATKLLISKYKADYTIPHGSGELPFVTFLQKLGESTNVMEATFDTSIQDWLDAYPGIIAKTERQTREPIFGALLRKHTRYMNWLPWVTAQIKTLVSGGANLNENIGITTYDETITHIIVDRVIKKSFIPLESFVAPVVAEFKQYLDELKPDLTMTNKFGKTVLEACKMTDTPYTTLKPQIIDLLEDEMERQKNNS